MNRKNLTGWILVFILFQSLSTQASEILDLARLIPGKTYAQNALWIETPLTARFNSSKTVTVVDATGPAAITVIHFAMPQTLKLNRDLLLKMYWDGEAEPSVDVPLVDFFCDPAGTRDEVNTAMVNKQRGFNAYFPMPFRRSARIELVYDGPVEPGEELWKIMPCYSYAMIRTDQNIDDDIAYFHAYWRQEGLLLGKEDYLALEAKGRGKFIGWNATVRRPGRSGYPVDENAKFYIDGEEKPSVELQGIEDSFGFSWGFPPVDVQFPYTGYCKFLQGAMAYRFFLNDAISFDRSLRLTIGFGENEDPFFRQEFSKPGNELQLSTVVYWYQREPHAPLPPLPAAAERAPAPENPLWPSVEKLPMEEELRTQGVKIYMLCGRPQKEVIFAEEGYGAETKKGYSWDGFRPPVYHCRADDKELIIELTVPPRSVGTVRLYAIDADQFKGGRKQEVWVGKTSLGVIEHFEEGRWLECPVSSDESALGRLYIRAQNKRDAANAVLSIVEWVEKK
ncbi:MAG: glycoside hydrolase family 172 protein [Candidatus Omnitrophota bacterium]